MIPFFAQTPPDQNEKELTIQLIQLANPLTTSELRNAISDIITAEQVPLLLLSANRHSQLESILRGGLLTAYWQDFFAGEQYQPHRLTHQRVTDPNQRTWFEIFAGIACFRSAQNIAENPNTTAECQAWLEMGMYYGDFLSMDRLCFLYLQRAKASDEHSIAMNAFMSALEIAKGAAQLHYSLGQGLLAETWCQWGDYFGTLSAPPIANYPCVAFYHQPLFFSQPALEAKNYPAMRNFCYREAMQNISCAATMSRFCSNLILNAQISPWLWMPTENDDFSTLVTVYSNRIQHCAPWLNAWLPNMIKTGELCAVRTLRNLNLEPYSIVPTGGGGMHYAQPVFY